MKLSIIVPVYNVEKYIVRCINSLVHQNFDDYEIIVVDDGSPDRSIEVLNESVRSNKISIIRQANAGLSSARNTGLKSANGEYIWFFDSDDWAEENCLGEIAKNLNGCDLLYFNKHYADTDNVSKVIEKKNSTTFGETLSMLEYYYQATFYIYKYDFLLKNKLQFTVGILHEDNMFTPITLYRARVVQPYDKPVYHVFKREGSITHVISPKRCYDLMKIISSHIAFAENEIKGGNKYAWGNCIADEANELLYLSIKCNTDVQADVNIFFKENPNVCIYLIHSRKKPSKVLGFLIKNVPMAPVSVYKLLYKLRY